MTAPPRSLSRGPRLRSLFIIGASALAALTALAACGEPWVPPPPPPGEPSQPPPPARPVAAAPAAPATASAPRPAESFPALRDRIVSEWIRDEPAFGRSLGLHQLDGKVGDYSAAGIQRRIARLTRDRAALSAVDRAALSPDEALDHAILLQHIDLFLFRMVDLEEWRRRPAFYEELFGVNDYLDRAYAPLADRARQLVDHQKAALAQMPHVRENLVSPLSKEVVAVSVKIFRGYAEYLRGDVVKLVKGAGAPADFEQTNAALAAEADKLADHLEKVELPRGDASHVLGEQRYKKLLLAQEGLTLPLAEFKKMGEDDLAENKAAYLKLQKVVKITRPEPGKLLAEATRLMDDSRRFLIDKKIVTIPSDERATVKETPPFMRWNAAFLRAPGPFEPKGLEAYYYITMPDPSWPKKEQEEYLMPFGTLLATSVHEVWPGHFLQHLWAHRAPTNVQRMLASYSFVEGWAHYTEQMMIDEGFRRNDPQSRIGQLGDALLRNCRFVVSFGVHVEGMTMEQAARRFAEDCFQDSATARQQATRATFDPGYFAYTLGKLQILKLRAEARAALGPKFSLQRFHDALLSHGGPPVALIRERVLAEIGAKK